MDIKRRKFLGLLIAAPVIVRASSLMRIESPKIILPKYLTDGNFSGYHEIHEIRIYEGAMSEDLRESIIEEMMQKWDIPNHIALNSGRHRIAKGFLQ